MTGHKINPIITRVATSSIRDGCSRPRTEVDEDCKESQLTMSFVPYVISDKRSQGEEPSSLEF